MLVKKLELIICTQEFTYKHDPDFCRGGPCKTCSTKLITCICCTKMKCSECRDKETCKGPKCMLFLVWCMMKVGFYKDIRKMIVEHFIGLGKIRSMLPSCKLCKGYFIWPCEEKMIPYYKSSHDPHHEHHMKKMLNKCKLCRVDFWR